MQREVEKLDFTNPLRADCVREMEKHARFSIKNAVQHFDSIAVNYEDCQNSNDYPDPQFVGDYVKKYAGQKGISLADTKILDFGCGTGLVGKELSKHGCKKIDGIDCSSEMLKQAKAKGIYSDLHHVLLGMPNNYMDSLPFQCRNHYDIVVGSDFLNTQFVSQYLVEQILFSMKPNGIAIFASQHSFMGNFWYFNVLEDMEKEGRIKILKDEQIYYRFTKLNKGIGKYSKTPAKQYAFQKLEFDSIKAQT